VGRQRALGEHWLDAHCDVRRVDEKTERVLASRTLAANRFGEGLTLLHGRLYQLTWEDGVATRTNRRRARQCVSL